MTCNTPMPCECGGIIVPSSGLQGNFDLPFACSACFLEFQKIPRCTGEVKKNWAKGGQSVLDCICETCGVSHGAGAVERMRILESFQAF